MIDSTVPTPALMGIAYAIGEQRCPYTDVVELEQTLRRHGMAKDPALWGWGTFYRTARPLVALITETARRTLALTGASPGEIDALILSAVHFHGQADAHAQLSAETATALNLTHAWCFGITLNRCASMVSALAVAADLIRSRRYRNIMVVSADKIADELERFERFGIFSDCASSCLVTSAQPGSYEILSSAHAASDARAMADGGVGGSLARIVNQQLFEGSGNNIGDVASVFHDNLFLPIAVMRELQAGFAKEQLFLGNIATKAHCFASDPLVNLADRTARIPFGSGQILVLASGTPGLRVAMLLRQA